MRLGVISKIGMDFAPLIEFCASVGFGLSEKQLEHFSKYLDALYDENTRTNLTRVPKAEAVVRHLVDSLLCVDLIPQGARCLDIGTGPGLPAFAIACCRPDVTVVAMDSTEKALRPLAQAPLKNLTCRVHRGEAPDEREQYDFVTGRALAPLGVQLEVSAAWCRVGGIVVPYRTVSEAGIAKTLNPRALGLRLVDMKERTLPGTDAVRLFPVFLKQKKTPKTYPRPWAEIKKSPWGS